jgi:enoyl-CoA hydratase/carnithine racemase
MPSSQVEYAVSEHIATLTLNRPKALNAWTPEMEEAYYDRLGDAAADDEVRVIVVTGAGRGFCAGKDMGMLGDVARAGEDEFLDPARLCLPLRIPKPIIAAINGPCAGIGLIQALMCDIRFVANDAKLTTAFARRGIIAEYNLAWLLPRLIGQAAALDLILSGRVVRGEEAAVLGLANRSVPGPDLTTSVRAYADDVARHCSPIAMAVSKTQVYRFLEEPLLAATAASREWMYEGLRQDDIREGVASFVERREPQFPPLSVGLVSPLWQCVSDGERGD